MRRAAVLCLCLGLLSCSTTETLRTAPRSTTTGSTTTGSTTTTSTTPGSSTTASTTTTQGPSAVEPAEPAPSVSSAPAVGPSVLPDSLFPDLGTAAIDVQSYDIDWTFDPADRVLHGKVAMAITAVDDLREILLDSSGPEIESVTVGGGPATFAQRADKLVITPSTEIPGGASFALELTYRHDTRSNEPPSGFGPSATGWFNTPGGAYVLNEPDGTRRYLPSNDHPSDKAMWVVTLRLPTGLTGISNGTLEAHETTADGEVYVWRGSAPMATYLLQVLIGEYTIIDDQVPGGPKLSSVILTDRADELKPCLDSIVPQLEFFEQYFGRYPFDTYGLALTDSFSGLAMETQERSLFSASDMYGCPHGPDPVMAHELAHQWFGDAVTLGQWKDIWLNESFATYGEWMWSNRDGSIEASAQRGLEMRSRQATGDPTVDEMFGINSYDGGAVVLHALRLTVGDDTFFRILRRWAADNYGQSRTTEDFIALCEAESRQQLDDFFQTWLYSADVPADYPAATQ